MIYAEFNNTGNYSLILGPIIVTDGTGTYVSGKKEYYLNNFICCSTITENFSSSTRTYGIGCENGETTFNKYGTQYIYTIKPLTKKVDNTLTWYLSVTTNSGGTVDYPAFGLGAIGQFNNQNYIYYYWALTA